MKRIEIILFTVGFAIIVAVPIIQSYRSAECEARGGKLLRGPLSGYECYKAEAIK